MTRIWTDPYTDPVASYRLLYDHKKTMACVLFPKRHEKKDRRKRSDQPNGISDTSVGPKFYPEVSPEDAGKANDLS